MFNETGAGAALIVPVVHAGASIGAMVMIASGRDISREDWKSFAQGIANQLALSISLGRAVSEKRASEALAREQEALVRLVLETVPEGVVVADERGAIQPWHSHVGEHDIDAFILDGRHRLHSVGRLLHDVALLLEEAGDQLADRRLIVDHEYRWPRRGRGVGA